MFGRYTKKIITFVLAVAFISQYVLSDAAAMVSPVRPEYDVGMLSHIEELDIPSSLGRVEYSMIPEDARRVVIHVQDAHCNYNAQKAISGLLSFIFERCGVGVVNLEGGAGAYDLSPFTRIEDPASRLAIAEHFMREGTLSAGEYFGITNPGELELWGVEDAELYYSNLGVYRSFLDDKEKALRITRTLERALNVHKVSIYSEEMLKLDRNYAGYKSGNKPLRDYLTYIEKVSKEAGMTLEGYPNLSGLFDTVRREGDIDFKMADIERDELFDLIRKDISSNGLEMLIVLMAGYKRGEISSDEFYERVFDIARFLRIDMTKFPNLTGYVSYRDVFAAVDKIAIFDELKGLEKELRDQLARTELERELAAISRAVTLAGSLFEVKLTPGDHRELRDEKELLSARSIAEFLTRAGSRDENVSRLDEELELFEAYLGEMSRFYEYAFKRDSVFLDNMKFSKCASGVESAILVTGGFHTTNLARIARDRGMAFISVIPSFGHDKTMHNPYHDLLAGRPVGLQGILDAAMSTIQIANILNPVLSPDRERFALSMKIIKAAMAMEEDGRDCLVMLPGEEEDLRVRWHEGTLDVDRAPQGKILSGAKVFRIAQEGGEWTLVEGELDRDIGRKKTGPEEVSLFRRVLRSFFTRSREFLSNRRLRSLFIVTAACLLVPALSGSAVLYAEEAVMGVEEFLGNVDSVKGFSFMKEGPFAEEIIREDVRSVSTVDGVRDGIIENVLRSGHVALFQEFFIPDHLVMVTLGVLAAIGAFFLVRYLYRQQIDTKGPVSSSDVERARVRRSANAHTYDDGKGFVGVDLEHFVFAQRVLSGGPSDEMLNELLELLDKDQEQDVVKEEKVDRIYQEITSGGYTAEILNVIMEDPVTGASTYDEERLDRTIFYQNPDPKVQGISEAVSNSIDALLSVAEKRTMIGQFGKGVKQIIAWLENSGTDKIEVFSRMEGREAFKLTIVRSPEEDYYIQIHEVGTDDFIAKAREAGILYGRDTEDGEEVHGTIVNIEVDEGIPTDGSGTENEQTSQQEIIDAVRSRFPFVKKVDIYTKGAEGDFQKVNSFENKEIIVGAEDIDEPGERRGRVNVIVGENSILVADNGSGMDSRALSRMFAPGLGEKQDPEPLSEEDVEEEIGRTKLVHDRTLPRSFSFSRNGEVVFSFPLSDGVAHAVPSGQIIMELGRLLKVEESRDRILVSSSFERALFSMVERLLDLDEETVPDTEKIHILNGIIFGLEQVVKGDALDEKMVKDISEYIREEIKGLLDDLRDSGYAILPHLEDFKKIKVDSSKRIYVHSSLLQWEGAYSFVKEKGVKAEIIPSIKLLGKQKGRRREDKLTLVMADFEPDLIEEVRELSPGKVLELAGSGVPVIKTEDMVIIPAQFQASRILHEYFSGLRDGREVGPEEEELAGKILTELLNIFSAEAIDTTYGFDTLSRNIYVDETGEEVAVIDELDDRAISGFLRTQPASSGVDGAEDSGPQSAPEYFKRALSLVEEISDAAEKAKGYALIAKYYAKKGYGEESRSCLSKAVDLIEDITSTRDKISTLGFVAGKHFESGTVPEKKRFGFYRAENIINEMESPEKRIELYLLYSREISESFPSFEPSCSIWWSLYLNNLRLPIKKANEILESNRERWSEGKVTSYELQVMVLKNKFARCLEKYGEIAEKEEYIEEAKNIRIELEDKVRGSCPRIYLYVYPKEGFQALSEHEKKALTADWELRCEYGLVDEDLLSLMDGIDGDDSLRAYLLYIYICHDKQLNRDCDECVTDREQNMLQKLREVDVVEFYRPLVPYRRVEFWGEAMGHPYDSAVYCAYCGKELSLSKNFDTIAQDLETLKKEGRIDEFTISEFAVEMIKRAMRIGEVSYAKRFFSCISDEHPLEKLEAILSMGYYHSDDADTYSMEPGQKEQEILEHSKKIVAEVESELEGEALYLNDVKGLVNEELARYYSHIGKNAESKNKFRSVLNDARKIEDEGCKIRRLIEIAYSQYELGMYEEALDVIGEIRRLARGKDKNRGSEVLCCLLESVVHSNLGEEEKAEALLETAVETFEEIYYAEGYRSFPHYLTMKKLLVIQDLGKEYRKRMVSALESYIKVDKELGRDITEAKELLCWIEPTEANIVSACEAGAASWPEIFYMRNWFLEGGDLEYLEIARTYYDEKAVEEDYWINLARIYNKHGDGEKALYCLEKAEDAMTGEEITGILRNLSEAWAELGEIEEAKKWGDKISDHEFRLVNLASIAAISTKGLPRKRQQTEVFVPDVREVELWRTVLDKRPALIKAVQRSYRSLLEIEDLPESARAVVVRAIRPLVGNLYSEQEQTVRRKYLEAVKEGKELSIDIEDGDFPFTWFRTNVNSLLTPLSEYAKGIENPLYDYKQRMRNDFYGNLFKGIVMLAMDRESGAFIQEIISEERRIEEGVFLALACGWELNNPEKTEALPLIAEFVQELKKANNDTLDLESLMKIIGFLSSFASKDIDANIDIVKKQVDRLLDQDKDQNTRHYYLSELTRVFSQEEITDYLLEDYLDDRRGEYELGDARGFVVFLTHDADLVAERESFDPMGRNVYWDTEEGGIELSRLHRLDREHVKKAGEDVVPAGVVVDFIDSKGAEALPGTDEAAQASLHKDAQVQAPSGAYTREIAQNSRDSGASELVISHYLREGADGSEEFVEEASDNGSGALQEMALLLPKSTKAEFEQRDVSGFFGRGKYTIFEGVDNVEIITRKERSGGYMFSLRVDRNELGEVERIMLTGIREIDDDRLENGVTVRRIKKVTNTIPELDVLLSKRSWRVYAGLSQREDFTIYFEEFNPSSGETKRVKVLDTENKEEVELLSSVEFPHSGTSPVRVFSVKDMPSQLVAKGLRVGSVSVADIPHPGEAGDGRRDKGLEKYLELIPPELRKYIDQLGLTIDIPFRVTGNRGDFAVASDRHIVKDIKKYVAIAFWRALAYNVLTQSDPQFTIPGLSDDWEYNPQYTGVIRSLTEASRRFDDGTARAVAFEDLKQDEKIWRVSEKFNEEEYENISEEELRFLLEDAGDPYKFFKFLLPITVTTEEGLSDSMLGRRLKTFEEQKRGVREREFLKRADWDDNNQTDPPHLKEKRESLAKVATAQAQMGRVEDFVKGRDAYTPEEERLVRFMENKIVHKIGIEQVLIITEADFAGAFKTFQGKKTFFLNTSVVKQLGKNRGWFVDEGMNTIVHELAHYFEEIARTEKGLWQRGFTVTDFSSVTHDRTGPFADLMKAVAFMMFADDSIWDGEAQSTEPDQDATLSPAQIGKQYNIKSVSKKGNILTVTAGDGEAIELTLLDEPPRAPPEGDISSSALKQHKDVVENILGLLPDDVQFHVFKELFGDLFGLASPADELIALHSSIKDDPVAVFHEIGEYLIREEKLSFDLLEGGVLQVKLEDKPVHTIDVSEALSQLREEGESWATIDGIKDKGNHYLLRVFQRAVFGNEDRILTTKIEVEQLAERVKKGFDFSDLLDGELEDLYKTALTEPEASSLREVLNNVILSTNTSERESRDKLAGAFEELVLSGEEGIAEGFVASFNLDFVRTHILFSERSKDKEEDSRTDSDPRGSYQNRVLALAEIYSAITKKVLKNARAITYHELLKEAEGMECFRHLTAEDRADLKTGFLWFLSDRKKIRQRYETLKKIYPVDELNRLSQTLIELEEELESEEAGKDEVLSRIQETEEELEALWQEEGDKSLRALFEEEFHINVDRITKKPIRALLESGDQVGGVVLLIRTDPETVGEMFSGSRSPAHEEQDTKEKSSGVPPLLELIIQKYPGYLYFDYQNEFISFLMEGDFIYMTGEYIIDIYKDTYADHLPEILESEFGEDFVGDQDLESVWEGDEWQKNVYPRLLRVCNLLSEMVMTKAKLLYNDSSKDSIEAELSEKEKNEKKEEAIYEASRFVGSLLQFVPVFSGTEEMMNEKEQRLRAILSSWEEELDRRGIAETISIDESKKRSDYVSGDCKVIAFASRGKGIIVTDWDCSLSVREHEAQHIFFGYSRRRSLKNTLSAGKFHKYVRRLKYFNSFDKESFTREPPARIGKQYNVTEVCVDSEKLTVKEEGKPPLSLSIIESSRAPPTHDISSRASEQYKDVVKEILDLLPDDVLFYVFEELFGDLFGLASPADELIALHSSIKDDPVAVSHEIGEYLIGTGDLSLSLRDVKGDPELIVNIRGMEEVSFRVGHVLKEMRSEGEIWAATKRIAEMRDEKDRNHYLLRVFQRAAFKHYDRSLTRQIKLQQSASPGETRSLEHLGEKKLHGKRVSLIGFHDTTPPNAEEILRGGFDERPKFKIVSGQPSGVYMYPEQGMRKPFLHSGVSERVIIEVVANLENPLDDMGEYSRLVDKALERAGENERAPDGQKGIFTDEGIAISAMLIEEGYDGVILRVPSEDGEKRAIIVLEPSRIQVVGEFERYRYREAEGESGKSFDYVGGEVEKVESSPGDKVTLSFVEEFPEKDTQRKILDFLFGQDLQDKLDDFLLSKEKVQSSFDKDVYEYTLYPGTNEPISFFIKSYARDKEERRVQRREFFKRSVEDAKRISSMGLAPRSEYITLDGSSPAIISEKAPGDVFGTSDAHSHIKVLSAIFRALGRMHQAGVVHGDLVYGDLVYGEKVREDHIFVYRDGGEFEIMFIDFEDVGVFNVDDAKEEYEELLKAFRVSHERLIGADENWEGREAIEKAYNTGKEIEYFEEAHKSSTDLIADTNFVTKPSYVYIPVEGYKESVPTSLARFGSEMRRNLVNNRFSRANVIFYDPETLQGLNERDFSEEGAMALVFVPEGEDFGEKRGDIFKEISGAEDAEYDIESSRIRFVKSNAISERNYISPMYYVAFALKILELERSDPKGGEFAGGAVESLARFMRSAIEGESDEIEDLITQLERETEVFLTNLFSGDKSVRFKILPIDLQDLVTRIEAERNILISL